MKCIFCEVIHGVLPAAVVFEDERVVAFLDHKPLYAGHVLLVPREHVETLGDLAPEMIEPLFATAKRLSRAVERGMNAEGTFVAMNNRVSQSVPHLHVHVVPRRKGDGLRGFFWPRAKYASESEMADVRQKIADALNEGT